MGAIFSTPLQAPAQFADRSQQRDFQMNGLRQEIAAFLNAKESAGLEARQMAALQIACHFDLAEALRADAATRARIALRLERMIERERLRGARKHWSYDLNRHIALKLARDDLRAWLGVSAPSRPTGPPARRKRRRRPQAPSISV